MSITDDWVTYERNKGENLLKHAYAIDGVMRNLARMARVKRRGELSGSCMTLMLDEFYSVAFRKKIYHSLNEIQEDADRWIEEYNTQRTHSGKYCFGKTPWQTFLEAGGRQDAG